MATTTAPRSNGRGPRVPLAAAEPPVALAPPPPANVSTPNLDAAVLRVQATAGKLIRNADGQIQSRFYRYVTLDAVTDEVLPLLVEESLLWKTFPTALDGEPALRYRMTHVPSGEFDEDTMLLLCDRTSQGQGSGETYARRYSLVAYLNLTVDPDDDGAGANLVPVDRYAEAEAAHAELGKDPNSRQPVARPPQPSPRHANEKQRNMLEARARAAKLSELAFVKIILDAKGETPKDPSRLTEQTAPQWLKRELDRLPASLVTQVKEAIGG